MLDRPTNRTIFQNAWVVDDLEAAMNVVLAQAGPMQVEATFQRIAQVCASWDGTDPIRSNADLF